MQRLALRTNQVIPLINEAACPHQGVFLNGSQWDVGFCASILQDLAQFPGAVASIHGQRFRVSGQLLQEARHCLPFTLRCVSYSASHDEPAQIHYHVVLIAQFRRALGRASAPTSVGVNRVQRQPAFPALEVPYLLTIHP